MGSSRKRIVIKFVYFLSVLIFLSCSDKENKGNEIKVTTINTSIEGVQLYFYSYSWGISGNNSKIVLSDRELDFNEFKNASNIDFYVYTIEPEIYYKQLNEDTLLLYMGYPSKLPVNFKGSFVIIQNELKDASEISYYAKYYDKLGLEIISVYDK